MGLVLIKPLVEGERLVCVVWKGDFSIFQFFNFSTFHFFPYLFPKFIPQAPPSHFVHLGVPRNFGKEKLAFPLRTDTSGGGMNFGALFHKVWISYFPWL